MASGGEERRESRSPERVADSALDFLSPQFCPEQALASSPSRIRLPWPEVQPCDNLDVYSSVIRGLSRRLAPTGGGSGPAHLRAKREDAPARVRRQPVKSVLTVMETVQSGPLSVVQRCLSDGVRVRVWVRHCAGVRGECWGKLLAFDKHLNLVLGDVQEEYCPFRTVANGGLEPKACRRRQRHKAAAASSGGGQGGTVKLNRILGKLFIRGDNVVIISPAPS